MAARKNLSQNDACREKIQTSQLINRLQDSVLKKSETDAEPEELTTNQLKAIEILLRKSLPDLSAVTIGGGDTPVKLTFEWLTPQS